MLDAYFTRSFYKHILGESLSYHDMEDINKEYYKSIKYITNNDCSDLNMTFSYETFEFGKVVLKDLIKDGRNIPVTEKNK